MPSYSEAARLVQSLREIGRLLLATLRISRSQTTRWPGIPLHPFQSAAREGIRHDLRGAMVEMEAIPRGGRLPSAPRSQWPELATRVMW